MLDTIIIKKDELSQSAVRQAAKIWKQGGLIGFPTETVYGLGANGFDKDACLRIYAAKERPADNPLIYHIAERAQLEGLVSEVNVWAQALMDAFWPGPLTLIMPKAAQVPYEGTAGLETVAVRMPSHETAITLLKEVGLPIAAPSANRSGRPSPTSASHVIEDMQGRIEMIVDGGDVGIGVESTIVDVTGERPMLLRPGFVTKEMIEAVVGPIDADKAVYHQLAAGEKPKAPGMKYRHYAPKASMLLVEGETDAVVSYINKKIQENPNRRIGVMATEETLNCYQGGIVLCVGARSDTGSIAHNLFRVLREFDRLEVDEIFSESFLGEGEGLAVMNRLLKAAGHQVISVSGDHK